MIYVWLLVVQCDNVLLRAGLCLHEPLRGPLHQLLPQCPCWYTWLPVLYGCNGVLGKTTNTLSMSACGGTFLYWLCIFARNNRFFSSTAIGYFVSDWEIWSECSLGNRVRLHSRNVSHRDQEPSSWNMFFGGKDWRNHIHAPRFAQGLLAACSSFHHGSSGNFCRSFGSFIPWDPWGKTSRDSRWCDKNWNWQKQKLLLLLVSKFKASLRRWCGRVRTSQQHWWGGLGELKKLYFTICVLIFLIVPVIACMR